MLLFCIRVLRTGIFGSEPYRSNCCPVYKQCVYLCLDMSYFIPAINLYNTSYKGGYIFIRVLIECSRQNQRNNINKSCFHGIFNSWNVIHVCVCVCVCVCELFLHLNLLKESCNTYKVNSRKV